jgi:hypothetical protein
MALAGAIDVPLELFGGLVTDMPAPDLPPGVSPDCQDVIFPPAAVKTRPGLLSIFAAIAGNPTVNYLKTFTDLSANQRLLFLDSLGELWQEYPGAGGGFGGTVTLLSSGLATAAYGKSATLFGREYLAINDGKFGIDLPRQFDTTNFDRVSQVGPGGAPAAADSAAAGSVAPGVHKVVVIFKTRQGYLTAPGPPASWTAAGSKQASVTSIPTGPGNMVARIVAFTGAGGASYYYTAAMVINDNTTTSLTVDFSDTALFAATNVDYLFRLVELGECSGVIDYASRLFWWGERNKANNWVDLTFNGGFSGNFPLGWTADGTFGAGGSQDTVNVAWQSAYRITGDGATATRGLITQGAIQDINGVALIAPNTGYSVRARVLKGGGLVQGTLHVHLFSVSGGINTTGLQVTAAQAGTSFAEFTASLTATLAGVATIPSDLVIRVYADGMPTNAGFFSVANIEIYPTLTPFNLSQVRASRTFDPESYDGINGVLQVADRNGQAVRAAFRLRERLYFVKEHSLFVTEDDGTNEPALWTISEVSNKVGTPSVNGVDAGEEWAVIAAREGLYIFWGREPEKISQEIQPTWDTINWQYGYTIWVRVDQRNRRILVGAPTGSATSPNKVLVLDYRQLNSAEEIASYPSVHYSSFTGKLFAVGRARKWTVWNITANSGALAERTDGTAQMFLGNGAGNGKVYQLSDTQLSDDGAAINGYYTTYFFLEPQQEQAFQMGSHRKLFTYLTAFVEGSGTLNLTALGPGSVLSYALPSLALASPSKQDLEATLNVMGERVAFKLSTNAVGSWMKVQRFTPSIKPDPWKPVRGT